jgi:nicotinamide riboside transporter PnuC
MEKDEGMENTQSPIAQLLRRIFLILVFVIGGFLFMHSLIAGTASAPHYGKLLIASLESGIALILAMAVALTLSKWEYKWVFWIPIVLIVINIWQIIHRLAYMVSGK